MKTLNNTIRISILSVLLGIACVLAGILVLQCTREKEERRGLYSSIWIFNWDNVENLNLPDISISFVEQEDGIVQFNGFSGVNYFSGSYKVFGRKLALVSGINATKMMGPKDLVEREEKFLEFLSKAESFAYIEDNGLKGIVIGSQNMSVTAFKFNLEGKKYTINVPGYNIEEIVYDDGNGLPFIYFDEDSLASVYTGVNYVGGMYVFIPESNSFEFIAGLSTKALGSEAENSFEEKLLELLASCESFSLEGNDILLYDSEKNNVICLTKEIILNLNTNE